MGEFGDLPRQLFSVPIALGLAKAISKKLPISSGLMEKSVLDFNKEVNREKKTSKIFNNNKFFHDLNCLDLGCGEGYLGRYLNIFDAKYLGIDGSYYLIRTAKENEKPKKLEYKMANLDYFTCNTINNPTHNKIKMFFNTSKIDIVFCHSIIEHLINYKNFFSHFSKWVYLNYPQAIISLICLDEQFLTYTSKSIKKMSCKNSPFSYSLNVPFTGNSVKINFFSDNDIKNVIESNCFKIIDQLSFSRNLFPDTIRALLDLKFKKSVAGGPFRAYLFSLDETLLK